MISYQDVGRNNLGSGAVIAIGLSTATIVLIVLGRLVGWDATWRAFGVTPLQPAFYDMHVINDYAACVTKEIDAYAPHACNEQNFNIPRAWLSVGLFGVDGTDSAWLSLTIIAAAAVVMVLLCRNREWFYGIIALSALVSPSVMMGVERGNLDLLILALVGGAALLYDDARFGRTLVALGLISLGIFLKLLPVFCVSLAARFDKRNVVSALIIGAVGAVCLYLTFDDVLSIRRNVPTTFMLSYGYKTIFLGIDHIRSEAGLGPWRLADTWLPALTTGFVALLSLAVAARRFVRGHECCTVDASSVGTAFLFGAGIFCGSYVLGTNFIYRLMFLLLCIPQLLDWQAQSTLKQKPMTAESLLLFVVVGVLWLNGNANGHTSFLVAPQLLNGFLFFLLSSVLILNFLCRIRIALVDWASHSHRIADGMTRRDGQTLQSTDLAD